MNAQYHDAHKYRSDDAQNVQSQNTWYMYSVLIH